MPRYCGERIVRNVEKTILEAYFDDGFRKPLLSALRSVGLLGCLALCLLFLDFLYDVEDFAAAVISTSDAHRVRWAKGPAVGTFRKRRALESVVTAAIARVGSRVTHSNNHTGDIIAEKPGNAIPGYPFPATPIS